MAAILDKTSPPAYLVVAAQDMPGKYAKGDIVEVLAKGTLKSDWCIPPNWVWATIIDKSWNQVNVYRTKWKIHFEHILLNQNDNGWRFEIAVDPIYISASDKNKNQIKQEMADYLNNCSTNWSSFWYKSSIFGWTSSSITIDVPKPFEGNPAYVPYDPEWILRYKDIWPVFLTELKNDFHDKFADITDIRRYKFKSASVDAVVNMGGEWSGTHVQAFNHIVDKLSE